jgi:hypothetical protein
VWHNLPKDNKKRFQNRARNNKCDNITVVKRKKKPYPHGNKNNKNKHPMLDPIVTRIIIHYLTLATSQEV